MVELSIGAFRKPFIADKVYARLPSFQQHELAQMNDTQQASGSEKSPHSVRQSWSLALICCATALGLIVGASLTFLTLKAGEEPQFSTQDATAKMTCGSSLAEAVAFGCKYDIVTNNWVPEQCFDVETAEEFRAWVMGEDRLRRAWPYFRDIHAQLQVDSEETMSQLVGQRIWTTTENHLGHCTFLMRRLHRLLDGHLESISEIDFAHTIHCSSSILRAIGRSDFEDRGKITSGFDVGISGC